MIKCGECVRHDNCWVYDEHKDDNGTCVWAEVQSDMTESPNDVIESQNDVIKKPRTVRYKLHKPIEYVSMKTVILCFISGIVAIITYEILGRR